MLTNLIIRYLCLLPQFTRLTSTMAAAPVLFSPEALTHFFENGDAMALSNRTRLRLQVKGIVVPIDFQDFDSDGLDAIFANLAKPPKIQAIRAQDRAAGRLMEVMSFKVSAKSKMRLKEALKIAKFYENVGRELDPENMTWDVIKRFLDQWKALMQRKTEDAGLPPKLNKSVPVHKWLESMVLFLGKKVGVRDAPLSYIVRPVGTVAVISPPRQAGEPHSEMYESIEGDLTARLSHAHALFKVDNGTVFDLIESSTRGSDVSPTIAPFRKTRNGRGAMQALKTQHAGKDIWDRLVKEAEHTLSTRVWSGTTPITLSQHMGMHRTAWITMTECAEHIPVDVPNDRARVTYLMDSIKTVDPQVLAAIAAVHQDEADKRVHFEHTFAYLVPVCPVTAKASKKTGRASIEANVSGTTGNKQQAKGGLGGGNDKPGTGSTGVALRYHRHKEFHALNKEQKDELVEWTKANGGKKTGGKKAASTNKQEEGGAPSIKKFKSMISQLEARQSAMFEAMAEVQQSSMNAIHAGVSATSGSIKPITKDSGDIVSKDVYVERAHVAMLKLNSILKAKDGKKGA